MDTIEERLPPNSIEAEEAVLGSILIDPDAYYEVARILTQPADFFRAPNRWIWEAICELNETGLAVDVVTLIDKLRQRGRLEEAGGEAKIISLLNAVPTSINAEAYAQLVQQAAVRRRLLTAAGTVARLAYDEGKPLPEVLGAAQRALDGAAALGTNGTAEAADMIDRAHERLMAARNGEVKPFYVASGAKDLDALLCPGFKPGLTVIGARPGMGKTSLILWMMTNQIRLGKRAALFALETIEEQVINKMLAAALQVPYSFLEQAQLTDEQWETYDILRGKWRRYPLWINDTQRIPISALVAEAKRLHNAHDLDILYIDHAGLITTPGERFPTETAQATYVADMLMALANELAIPVVAALQLNRGPESRQDKRPTLADLRSSGSWEANARAVLLLYRDEYYAKERSDALNQAEVEVAKNRYDPTGVVRLFFNTSLGKFGNLAVKDINLA
ncbi:MAG: replicative DNA helicase [Candidatus Promineofilum sp.]|nr:replicative DNA helicase [Promineifilum sp.]